MTPALRQEIARCKPLDAASLPRKVHTLRLIEVLARNTITTLIQMATDPCPAFSPLPSVTQRMHNWMGTDKEEGTRGRPGHLWARRAGARSLRESALRSSASMAAGLLSTSFAAVTTILRAAVGPPFRRTPSALAPRTAGLQVVKMSGTTRAEPTSLPRQTWVCLEWSKLRSAHNNGPTRATMLGLPQSGQALLWCGPSRTTHMTIRLARLVLALALPRVSQAIPGRRSLDPSRHITPS